MNNQKQIRLSVREALEVRNVLRLDEATCLQHLKVATSDDYQHGIKVWAEALANTQALIATIEAQL